MQSTGGGSYDDRDVLRSENFDYTKWQQEHYANISVADLNTAAAEYMAQHPELKPKNAKIIIE